MVYQNTGSAITPTLTIKHANAADNWSASTSDVSAVSLQSCASGAWTQVAYTFTAHVSSGNGVEVTLDFGSALNIASKQAITTNWDLRITPGVSTGLNAVPPLPELRSVMTEMQINQRYFQTSYDNIAPGTAAVPAGCLAIAAYGTLVRFNMGYKQTLRADPTVTAYSTTSGTSGVCYDATSASDVTVTLGYGGQNSGYFYSNSATGGHEYLLHFTLSAEL